MLSFGRDGPESVAVAGDAGAAVCAAADVSVFRTTAPIEAEWRAFETTAAGHVFQTADFLLAWLAHVGAGRGVSPLIAVGRAADGTVLFLLPFGIRRRLGQTVLEWLGAEHADYHCGLFDRRFLAGLDAAPEKAAALARDVLARVGGEADVVHLDRQPVTIDGFANPFAAYRPLRHVDFSHQTRLGVCWDDYYRGKRNASSRRNDRSKWRNLGTAGEVRLIDAESPADVRRILAALFAQKEIGLGSRGVANFFASDAVRAFYTELALKPWPKGPTHVAALECGGSIVAANWGLVRGNRYYYVMHSFASDHPLARWSPGRHLMYHLMQWSIARGIEVFDFTIGDEGFKTQWCEESFPLADGATAVSVVGLPLAASLRSFKTARRLIKSRPAMLAAANMVRRLAKA